jgi:CheY-like chemotaxis protein
MFARKSSVKLEPVNVNDTISELSGMLREAFPRTIEIVLDLDHSLPLMMMDRSQLHQAILNLCINGRDAMMNNQSPLLVAGTLTVKTSVVIGTELRQKFVDAIDGRYVCIAVSDTGAGMDVTVRKKIFEPFFTTKETGKGTGLGLSVVYGIVQGHRGHIEVMSEPGQGSTFRLYLPVPADHPIVKVSDSANGEIVPGGSETILLVEDEVELLTVMKVAMEGKGYTVLTAQDGIEAMKEYKENEDQIALVLSDVGLPKLDGTALFSRLKGLDPKVNFVLASGYLSPSLKSDLLQSGVKAFIQKPYDPKEVLRTIREILDQDS